MVDKKKRIIVFGLKETKEVNKTARNKELSEVISKVLEKVQEENRCLKNEMEEFHRLGRFKGEGFRPIRIKFKSQKDAEEALAGAWRLAGEAALKNVWLRRD